MSTERLAALEAQFAASPDLNTETLALTRELLLEMGGAVTIKPNKLRYVRVIEE